MSFAEREELERCELGSAAAYPALTNPIILSSYTTWDWTNSLENWSGVADVQISSVDDLKELRWKQSSEPAPWAGYAHCMSSFALAALTIVLLVIGAFIARVYAKRRQTRRPMPNRQSLDNRPDSTLGALRDLREALGPLASRSSPVASSASDRNGPTAEAREPARSAR